MLLFLAGSFAYGQVDRRLFGGDCELVHMLPPLGLEVLIPLLFSFLFFLELHLLRQIEQATTYSYPLLLANFLSYLTVYLNLMIAPFRHLEVCPGVINKHWNSR